MRRYHTAQATPIRALRATIHTQERFGTLWSPPKRNTAAGACKAPNSSELTTTATTVLLPDAGRMRSKALSKNNRHRISSPNEAVALANATNDRGALAVALQAWRWRDARPLLLHVAVVAALIFAYQRGIHPWIVASMTPQGYAPEAHYPSLASALKTLFTWHGFTEAILAQAGIACRVLPITSAEYPVPAKRPEFSVLDSGKLMSQFCNLPSWQKALCLCMAG